MLAQMLKYYILIGMITIVNFNSFSIETKQPKIALIIGITGQDGSYLAELLLEKDYIVHGTKRRISTSNTQRIDHLLDRNTDDSERFRLHYADINDAISISRIIQQVQPDEIYNLAAQSHVLISYELPEYTVATDMIGVINILESIRAAGLANKTKFYQASSSEMFGKVVETPQTEKTPFYPRSPYAVAKVGAFWATVNYREAYNMFACNGILFNHESPRRGEMFVTRKITQAVANIKYGLQDILYLGNLDAKRDWGYAKDYVEAMWLMLQKQKPQDFVIATGETHKVREFVEKSFKNVGIDIIWQGKDIDEKGIDAKTGKVVVAIDKRYFRPAEVDLLLGDATKAHIELGWQPQTNFEQLIKLMIENDCKIAQKNLIYSPNKHKIN